MHSRDSPFPVPRREACLPNVSVWQACLPAVDLDGKAIAISTGFEFTCALMVQAPTSHQPSQLLRVSSLKRPACGAWSRRSDFGGVNCTHRLSCGSAKPESDGLPPYDVSAASAPSVGLYVLAILVCGETFWSAMHAGALAVLVAKSRAAQCGRAATRVHYGKIAGRRSTLCTRCCIVNIPHSLTLDTTASLTVGGLTP